jgi:uncharacterized protein (TIGR02118 family)
VSDGKKVVVVVRPPYDETALRALAPRVLHLPVRTGGPAVLFLPELPSLEGLDAIAYRVEEHLQWDYQRTWPLGQPSPGIKRIAFLQRVPSITREEFARHWTEEHTPLARRHHPTLWRYAQNVMPEPLTPDTPPCDGIVELSFKDPADMTERMYDSAEGREIIDRDVATFLDVKAGWRVISLEHVLADGSSD